MTIIEMFFIAVIFAYGMLFSVLFRSFYGLIGDILGFYIAMGIFFIFFTFLYFIGKYKFEDPETHDYIGKKEIILFVFACFVITTFMYIMSVVGRVIGQGNIIIASLACLVLLFVSLGIITLLRDIYNDFKKIFISVKNYFRKSNS